MKRLLVAIAVSVSAVGSAALPEGDATVWATATSTHTTNGRVIIFRYVKEFRPGFQKSSLPDRVILVWRYESQSGLPATSEREAMDRMEEALAPAIDKPGFATLALVSTGENLREWTFYTKSEQEFVQALNAVFAKPPRFPIEIHAAPDPMWSTYERFRQGVRN
jgi:hypothetical protein